MLLIENNTLTFTELFIVKNYMSDIYISNYNYDIVIHYLHDVFIKNVLHMKKNKNIIYKINKVFNKYNSDIVFIKDYFYILFTIIVECLSIIIAIK